MRTLGTLALGLALLGFVLPAAAEDKGKAKDDTKKQLVGKWQANQKFGEREIKVNLEFTQDGDMKLSFGPQTLKGKYKVLDAKTLEIELTINVMGEEKTQKDKTEFKVTKDTLELKGKTGRTQKFTRVKK